MPQEITVPIKEIIIRAYKVKSFRVAVDAPDFKAGQFLSVTLKSDPALKRYLSISSSPTEGGYLEFTKKITESDFSRTLDSLSPGDEVTINYPMGKFTFDESYPKIAFLSGGIGITPIRSMCKYAADKEIHTDIILLYANGTIKDIAFRDDFERMQRQYPSLKVVHVLCEPDKGFVCVTGRINQGVIRENIPDYGERKFYLCGPPAMVEAMKKILSAELQVDADRIITENFQGY